MMFSLLFYNMYNDFDEERQLNVLCHINMSVEPQHLVGLSIATLSQRIISVPLYFVNLDSERVAFDSSKRYLEKQVSIRPPDATDVI